MNLVVSALFAGATCEAYLRGWTNLFERGDVVEAGAGLAKLVVAQSVLEYYWHRVMHFPFFYRRMHKMHHHYKSPAVWDDLFIDPREAFGYYCILYGTGVVVSAPVSAFLSYMAVMGTCGVLDHCGISFGLDLSLFLPWTKLEVYGTSFHDLHHAKFNANYAFPFAAMDVFHGTRVAAAVVAAAEAAGCPVTVEKVEALAAAIGKQSLEGLRNCEAKPMLEVLAALLRAGPCDGRALENEEDVATACIAAGFTNLEVLSALTVSYTHLTLPTILLV